MNSVDAFTGSVPAGHEASSGADFSRGSGFFGGSDFRADPDSFAGPEFFVGPAFLKGHGTENDFVLLPDPDGRLELTGERVRALCDRRRGLGADGVLRIVRGAVLGDRAEMAACAGEIPPDTWFMDYRNADGSVAEMCGNGVRVFAHFLVGAGWVDPGDVVVGTRDGLRAVRTRPSGEVSVDMGFPMFTGKSSAVVGEKRFDGAVVDVGNPHLACVIDSDLDALDLRDAPGYDPEVFPHGVNIEFIRRLGQDRVRMRVYERGVGETRSCGTGTVAAAVAALRADGLATGTRVVDVPGGTVTVEVTDATSTLSGPAVLTAQGRLSRAWWQRYVG